MNKKTLTALKGSIRKWEKIVAGTGTDEGPTNCPLCKMFYHRNCKGCPVMEWTEKPFCNDTPYTDYSRATLLEKTKSVMERLAKKELNFLKSFLPR